MKTVQATRYITPLREGGSVPAVIEADDGETYVLKFRAASQGPKALIAELLGGEIARQLGLNVPELVRIELDPLLARNEPHEEIRATINASAGLNLGMRFLSSAFAYHSLLKPKPEADLAARIVWLRFGDCRIASMAIAKSAASRLTTYPAPELCTAL